MPAMLTSLALSKPNMPTILEKAKAVVNAQMPTLGATMGADGKWQYKGKPVVVIGLIQNRRQTQGNWKLFCQPDGVIGFYR